MSSRRLSAHDDGELVLRSSPGVQWDRDSTQDDIVWMLFGDVGDILRDWSCAIERRMLLQGRMYVKEDAAAAAAATTTTTTARLCCATATAATTTPPPLLRTHQPTSPPLSGT